MELESRNLSDLGVRSEQTRGRGGFFGPMGKILSISDEFERKILAGISVFERLQGCR